MKIKKIDMIKILIACVYGCVLGFVLEKSLESINLTKTQLLYVSSLYTGAVIVSLVLGGVTSAVIDKINKIYHINRNK